MATDLRADESHNVSYPQTADTRGTARIYHMRKPYYLGSHDSPLSYVMFGLWKHRLMTSGEAPPTASLREQAEAFLAVTPPRRKRMLAIGLMAFSLSFTTLIGSMIGYSFRSTPAPTDVDGIALSPREKDFIRGVRIATERDIAARESNKVDVSTLAVKLFKGQVNRDEIFKKIGGSKD